MVAKELGFDSLIWDSMAGVSDCDFISETLQWDLSSTHNKDLQESIEPMLDHVKTVFDSIQIVNVVRCIAKSDQTDIPMNKLSFKPLKAIDSRLEEGTIETFVYETAVEKRSANGGTSKSSVLEPIQAIKAALSGTQA
ncbi:L-Aspartase-like protein [Trichoderma chlorosporum]